MAYVKDPEKYLQKYVYVIDSGEAIILKANGHRCCNAVIANFILKCLISTITKLLEIFLWFYIVHLMTLFESWGEI